MQNIFFISGITKCSFKNYVIISLKSKLEHKQREEEDKLYRKFLDRRREEEDNVARMAEEEREVWKKPFF